MKRFTTLCLFFAAFALFVGCSEDEEDFTGTINGIVTDADSGEPMNAVNISLNPGGKSAVTGTDGRYEFLDLEPGQYTVQAAKNDYQTNTKHVTIVAGGTVKSDIVLQKATSKLKLTNNSLNFGKNWSALSFGVGNAGITGKIDWRISSDIDWITVSPLSGTTETGKNTEVIVTVLRDKVSGPANGIITISDDGGSLPVYVTVNQDVQAADGENRITVEPENVALLSAYRKDVTICSYNSSANYELFVKEEDVSWLTFTKTMGILPVYNAEKPNTAVTVGFIADRSGLPAGEYKCTAVLRTGMGDLEIPVSMKVNADGSVDKTFEDFILENYDTDNDGVVSDEEAAGVTEIDCSNQGLVSLSGIERFTNLIDLNCSYNRLTELSLKSNVKLKYLRCDENHEMTSLDVSSNTALQSLTCGNNPLGTLDVSKNTELTHLACWNNSLTALDVSNNTKLEVLHCFINELVDLDVSKNLALTSLSFGYNQILSIDISKNTELIELYCENTKMQILDISANKKLQSVNCTYNESLTTIYAFSNYAATCTIEKPDATQIIVKGSGNSGNVGDMETVFPDANFRAYVLENFDTDNDGVISDEEAAGVTFINCSDKGNIASIQGIDKFVNLTVLSCEGNQLTTLDVSGCPALTDLNCGDNQLTALDVSGCPVLTELFCFNNQLTTLDISGCPGLTRLSCFNNQLTTLDVSGCPSLTELFCGGNQLTTLNVSGCSSLTSLSCGENQLTTLDVSSCLDLIYVGCEGNQLTTLDISSCSALKDFRCDHNPLTTLDVSGCPALTLLYCYENQLTTLDVSGCPALADLSCHENQLTTLDISGCPALKRLWCGNNPLMTLDVSGCPALTDLSCNNNQLTTLDVSGCPVLEKFCCRTNQLTTLDVSGCPALIELDYGMNQLTSLDVSGCPNLTKIHCDDNRLTTLDVSGCLALEFLWCGGNQLTLLETGGCTRLSELDCWSNQLITLDISTNTNLTKVDCRSNALLETIYVFSDYSSTCTIRKGDNAQIVIKE
ncbi:MAG: leucine-rich repeat domain-containing protein [Bacteroidaceae bacterium]|nr:leucine-rich repeat domain-containing protein [Bacteroidaceae bacterium]